MIRGKYLRERKAIKVKRRIKLLMALIVLSVLYKIIFNSYSLYESEASSNAEIDIAFYSIEEQYEKQTITIDDMLPGEEQYVKFSVANFYTDDSGAQVIAETDMKCDLKIRTTTNLPLEYELYIDQSVDSSNLVNRLDTEELKKGRWDEYDTIFKYLVDKNETDERKAEGITDSIDFSYQTPLSRTYVMKITFPETECKSYEYQNIMECIEIGIDSHQIIKGDQ